MILFSMVCFSFWSLFGMLRGFVDQDSVKEKESSLAAKEEENRSKKASPKRKIALVFGLRVIWFFVF